ncbi:MAG: D-2-hydroxyacid dehydrogenase [Muribaculaceae bacterium]|nr:D-2-hydroxyacid dehydrogenase [Muribaculaceae bacterium]
MSRNIVVLDAYTSNPGDLSWDGLRRLGHCTIHDRTPEELIVERSAEADALFINKVVLTREIMSKLPRLKYIGILATGFNIVDVKAARELGITVTNVPAYSTPSVAQLAFAHLLNICCQVQHYTDEVRDGMWSRCPDFSFTDTRLTELAGKRMGIVGFGQIGSAVARIAQAFGMAVSAHTSKRPEELPAGIEKAASLDDLFASCDVVSLHCPLTDDTRGMVNRERLALMKPDAILLNTSRGPLVDEQALADALNSGHLQAAGLDVMATEPPRADSPLLTARNCYLTPHIAWASAEARVRLMKVIEENYVAFLEGHAMNVVS